MPIPSADIDPRDLAACRALLRKGSKSFSLASLLLPKRVREPAAAIYAFCRVADDLVDEPKWTESSLLDRVHGGPRARTKATPAARIEGEGGEDVLEQLYRRLDRAYDGHPDDDPVDRAFSSVVRFHDIPKEVPAALLEGFAWDAQGRHYETIEDVQAYSARVAGTVGVMMTLLMGPRDAPTLERACDLGVAMQLTNIARDVGEDARNGRVYLPTNWLRDVGVERDAFLADPTFRPEIAIVIRQLLERAELLYARSDAGIAMLPSDCRVAIRAARLIYSEISHELQRRGLDSVNQRTVVGKGRKLWLVLRALLGRAPGESAFLLPTSSYEPLAETAFLVQATARREPLQLLEAGT